MSVGNRILFGMFLAAPRYEWIAAAAARPSAIAQTISDAPRWASPATKTPVAEVCQVLSQSSVPRGVWDRPSWQPFRARTGRPDRADDLRASRHSPQANRRVGAGAAGGCGKL